MKSFETGPKLKGHRPNAARHKPKIEREAMPERGIPQFSTAIHHKKGRSYDDEESGDAAVEVPQQAQDDGPESDTEFHALRSIPDPDPPGKGVHYVALVHDKSSSKKNDADALSKADEKSELKVETHKDGEGNDLPSFSLRDIHKSAENHAGAIDFSKSHAKHSKEQNAQNPDVEPERWIPPPREELAPPAPSDEIARPGRPGAAVAEEESEPAPPEIEIERVNLAPELPTGTFEECTPVDGRYRPPSSGTGKAGSGVVIRYQYELIQATRPGDGGGRELVESILPRLEEGITDRLLPVFFEGCNGAGGDVYDNRGLKGEGGLRRRMGGGEVVGIDAHPADVATGGGEFSLIQFDK